MCNSETNHQLYVSSIKSDADFDYINASKSASLMNVGGNSQESAYDTNPQVRYEI